MSWKETTIEKNITTKKGFAFKSAKYVQSGIPVVRVSDYTFDSISNANLKYYPIEEKCNYLDFQLHEKDVIVQTVGSWQNNPASVVGKVVRVPYCLDGALLNQNAVKLIPKESINNDYLFYRLKTDEFKGHVLGEARGAANQASITLKTIKSFEFLMPDYDSQCRIANILSAYDNLIENNQKQIKLLEEAAQRLYKEWFVDLHFPGYEDTKIVDGVPEGWERSKLQEISKFIRGKTITRKDVVDGTVPVVAGGFEPAYYHNKSITEKPVITVSGSGANAGFSKMYYQKIWASDCSYIDVNGTNYIYFTYCFLKENKRELANLQKGAAQPHVYAKDINTLSLKCPPDNILQSFETLLEPIFNKIARCIRTIEISQQARDRLLPKLMSGELEV